MTPEEFDQWIYLPENIETDYELIGGMPVEIAAIRHDLACLAADIAGLFYKYHQDPEEGYFTGARGVYCVGPDRYGPSLGYIRKARQPIPCKAAHNPLAPDLAIEILVPSEPPRELRIKLGNYLAAGTIVWVVSADDQEIEIYVPGQPVRILGIDDMLDGGDLFPDFKVAVKDIFVD